MPGRTDCTLDEKGPVFSNFHGNVGVSHIAGSQSRCDLARQRFGGCAAGLHRAHQRHGDGAGIVDPVGVGEVGIAVNADPQYIAAVEQIRPALFDQIGGRASAMCARAQKKRQQKQG